VVPAGVVDLLEPVEVDEDQGDLGALHRVVQQLTEALQ